MRCLLERSIAFFVVALALLSSDCWSRQPHGERTDTARLLDARPGDPRPRSRGHVVLAWPGTREEDKGYSEPGGSFSPGFGALGLSFWVYDGNDRLLTTSDGIDLGVIRQSLVRSTAGLPSLTTETPHYAADWTAVDEGRFELRLRPTMGAGRIAVAVRSVGPSGGPLQRLELVGNSLYVNSRWSLDPSSPPEIVRIGREPVGIDAEWRELKAQHDAVDSPEGWAYALLAWPIGEPFSIQVVDHYPVARSPLASHDITAPLELDLPDQHFAASLQAQVGHILMSLVRRQTRPGDPGNYPLQWLRDGAYVLVGLTRAGRQDVSRELLAAFCEDDYFGGFGAEGDAPGLALWAISEVVRASSDTSLLRQIYPDVHRKAELIGKMAHARREIRHEPVGNIVPKHRSRKDLDLVAEPPDEGLIRGRMDWGRPELFISAISYLGLRRAAEMATSMDDSSSSRRWSGWAGGLQNAWEQGFAKRFRTNERAFISGLHPSFIAARRRAEYEQALEWHRNDMMTSEGQYRSRPLWTYFEFAKAHQWLLLGRLDRAWSTLDYFFAHQTSPGLYTFWEGKGEENTFHRWEEARGWFDPENVTPHYWSAAELLLLQLSMLAYSDESAVPAGWVIGAGIPRSWLQTPFFARRVRTSLGRVDLEWDGTTLRASIDGPAGPVAAGPAFPRGSLRAEFVTR